MNATIRWLLLVAATPVLCACGGLSDVGNQDEEDAPPVAAAVVLNQPFSKDGAGVVTTRVRAGSEVFLSGKDSDGVVAPVLQFDWQPRNSAAQAIALITRNSNTVSFTAPAVQQETILQFRLTVTDSRGASDTEDVDALVSPVLDPDHFLSYEVANPGGMHFNLIAKTSRDVTAQELTGDVSFRITIRRLVDYTTPGVEGPFLETGVQQLEGQWLAAYGSPGSCGESTLTPSFTVARPRVDVDDILASIDPTDPALEPNPALVDSFQVKLQISIEVTGGVLPAGVAPQVCAPGVAAVAPVTPVTGPLELSLEQLAGAATNLRDTRESAEAYYAAIDPAESRTTFLAWLQETGFIDRDRDSFTWDELESGATAHALYTNNYDLGFGRDMYARVVACDGPTPEIGAALAVTQVGACDIAAVVVNYTSLEAATKKLNPALAVAMEYSRTPGSGNRRIVQFYTFAPDSITARFERVLSANLDGRGEKYMPQVCTSCHGGTPGGLPNGAPASGDVGAAFLLWDLDSFLYADAGGANGDQSYTDEPSRSRYTRAAQSEQLRRLNQIAYLTFSDAERPTRYVLAKDLAEGWYGKQTGAPDRVFINSEFNGQYVPAGWTTNGVDGLPNTADDNPAAASEIYHQVFARNCRACHVAHAPASNLSGPSLETLTTTTAAFNTCDATLQTDEPQWAMQDNQMPIGCYRHLVGNPTLGARLREGVMPFARLTFDRFWVSPDGGASPGGLLQSHLTAAGVATGVPGAPVLCIDPFGQASGSALAIERNAPLRLRSECSRFVDPVTWTLDAPAGSNARLIGATTRRPTFVPDRQGEYHITLTAIDGPEDANSTSVTAMVPVAAPVAASATREITLPASGSGATTVDVTALLGFSSIDPLSRIEIVAQSGVSATPLDAEQMVITAGSLAGGFVLYRLIDTDGDASDNPADSADDDRLGRIDVSVTANLVASDDTIEVAANGASDPIDLRDYIQPASAREAVTFSITQHPDLQRFRGLGSVSPSGSAIVAYSAPPGVASVFQNPGGDVVIGPSDEFTYEACLISDPGECDTGTITFTLRATQSFAEIENFVRPTCSGCHDTPPPGANLQINVSDASQTAFQLYCQIREGVSLGEAQNVAYIDMDNDQPEQSLFYRKPNGELGHVARFDDTFDPGNVADKIALWINEGAYFTGGADQMCSP